MADIVAFADLEEWTRTYLSPAMSLRISERSEITEELIPFGMWSFSELTPVGMTSMCSFSELVPVGMGLG